MLSEWGGVRERGCVCVCMNVCVFDVVTSLYVCCASAHYRLKDSKRQTAKALSLCKYMFPEQISCACSNGEHSIYLTKPCS